eukprot:evm.model.scf_2193.3 EVM.evm.TU.scf_2193.3   scf_2193:15173-25153(+)
MSSPAELAGLHDSVRVLLQDVWKFVGGLGDGGGDHSATAWLVDQQWRHFREACARLVERSEDGGLSVALVATAKSGKSTLMNALLGASCLPTNNVPETSGFCIVHHTQRSETNDPGDSKPKLVESSGLTSTGAQAVRLRIQELQEEGSQSENGWKMERPLEIYAPLQALVGAEAPVQLSLIDTPGLNEAKNDLPKHMLEKVLQDVDAVVYVLDYTKLKSPEEAQMLQAIKKINPSLVKRVWHRMFFVVNKFDVASTGHGLNEAETNRHVKTLLWDAGFRVKPEQILLVSANNALLSRLVLDDMADPAMRTKFGHLAFGPQYEIKIDRAEWHTSAQRMLESSGIQQVEEQVLGFLHSHSGLVKLLSLLDDAAKLLQDVGNVAASYKASLSCNLGDMTMYMERLKAQLDNTMMEFDAAKIGLQRIEDDVVSKVRHSLQKLRRDLLQRISRALSDNEEENPITSPGWRVIHEAFVELMSRQEVDRARCEDMLKDLHDDVTAQVQAEIDISWSMVSDLARERHQELVLNTNELLDRLSHQMESLIGKELGVHVDCPDFSFEPPTTAEFSSKVDELLQRGVQEQSLQRSTLYRYMAGGNYTVYAFDAAAIQSHFETLVREAAERCLRNVQGPFQDCVSSQIQVAEARLQEYSDHYVQAVQSAIDGHVAHISSHTGIMQKIADDLRSTKLLKVGAAEVLRRVEAWLRPTSPLSGSQSAGGYSEPDGFVDGIDETETVSALLTTSSRMHRHSGSGNFSGRYVPPQGRFPPQDAVAQMLSGSSQSPPNPPHDRSRSMPACDLVDALWDPSMQVLGAPPGLYPIGNGNGMDRTGSGNGGGGHDGGRGFGGRRGGGGGSNWRASQGSQFQPKSDFFRSFDKALRGGRVGPMPGRKPRGGHRRTTSWA